MRKVIPFLNKGQNELLRGKPSEAIRLLSSIPSDTENKFSRYFIDTMRQFSGSNRPIYEQDVDLLNELIKKEKNIFLSRIKRKIASGSSLKPIFKYLSVATIEYYKREYNQLILIEKRYNDWSQESRKGFEPELSRLNKIISDLIEICDEIVNKNPNFHDINESTKTFLWTIMAVFFVPFICGLIMGFEKRNEYSEEEFYYIYVSSQLFLERNGNDNQPKYILSYMDENGMKISFDIDSNIILNHSFSLSNEVQSKTVFERAPINTLSIVGGVGLLAYYGTNFGKMISRTRTSRFGRIAVYGLAIVPSFSLGYYIPLRKKPDAYSLSSVRKFHNFINNENNWKRLELLFYSRMLNNFSEKYIDEIVSVNFLDSIQRTLLPLESPQQYVKFIDAYKSIDISKSNKSSYVTIRHNLASVELAELYSVWDRQELDSYMARRYGTSASQIDTINKAFLDALMIKKADLDSSDFDILAKKRNWAIQEENWTEGSSYDGSIESKLGYEIMYNSYYK